MVALVGAAAAVWGALDGLTGALRLTPYLRAWKPSRPLVRVLLHQDPCTVISRTFLEWHRINLWKHEQRSHGRVGLPSSKLLRFL